MQTSRPSIVVSKTRSDEAIFDPLRPNEEELLRQTVHKELRIAIDDKEYLEEVAKRFSKYGLKPTLHEPLECTTGEKKYYSRTQSIDPLMHNRSWAFNDTTSITTKTLKGVDNENSGASADFKSLPNVEPWEVVPRIKENLQGSKKKCDEVESRKESPILDSENKNNRRVSLNYLKEKEISPNSDFKKNKRDSDSGKASKKKKLTNSGRKRRSSAENSRKRSKKGGSRSSEAGSTARSKVEDSIIKNRRSASARKVSEKKRESKKNTSKNKRKKRLSNSKKRSKNSKTSKKKVAPILRPESPRYSGKSHVTIDAPEPKPKDPKAERDFQRRASSVKAIYPRNYAERKERERDEIISAMSISPWLILSLIFIMIMQIIVYLKTLTLSGRSFLEH